MGWSLGKWTWRDWVRFAIDPAYAFDNWKVHEWSEGSWWDEHQEEVVIEEPATGRCTLLHMHFASAGEYTFQLHRFVGMSPNEPLHSHQARALRVILQNGYIEEYMRKDGSIGTKTWRAGMAGVIEPAYMHRTASLIDDKPATTLFIRGRTTHGVDLYWPHTDRRVQYTSRHD